MLALDIPHEWIAGVALIMGAIAYAIRRATASRESPQEKSQRLVMRALADIAERVEDLEHKIGRPCAFTDGAIPPAVEEFARRLVAEADSRRLRDERR